MCLTDRVLAHPGIVGAQGKVGEDGVGSQDCHLVKGLALTKSGSEDIWALGWNLT